MDDITKHNSKINEITTDLTEEIKSLNTLRNLKAIIESNSLTEKIQLDIDTLVLTNFKNTELQKLKIEILSIYETLEKETRTFYGFTYATLAEKNKAEQEYKKISLLRKKAENANNDINLRKNILAKINSMSFTIKNIAPILYDIDVICRTFHGFTYNSINELETAVNEKSTLEEFIKIDEILDKTREIYAIINIKNKVTEIKKHNYSNIEIKNYIKKIDAKISKIEAELKKYNNKTYSSLEYVQTIKEEVYYVESEAAKFDLLSRESLKLFLELMALREFKTEEAQLIIKDYRKQFIAMEDKEIIKEEKTQKEIQKKKKRTRLKIAIGIQIATFIGLIPSIVAIAIGGFSLHGTAFGLGIAGVLIFAFSVPFCLGYILYYNISNGIDFVKNKTKSIFK
ncbi:MAG: hypothetical protein ACRCWG_03270 [Sarcina sp.]